jgi:hypothetical protein
MNPSDLLAEIEKFCREQNMSEKTFGAYALNNSKLVQRLRDGGDIRIGTYNKVQAYIKGNIKNDPEH